MSLELIGKYIGADEIVSVSPDELKTPLGTDIVVVEFKNGKKKLFSTKALEYIVTENVSDASAVLEKKLTPVIRQIMEMLAEYDISVGEVEMLFKQVGGNIDFAFNRATSYLYFNTDDEFVPGFDPMHNVSLLMAHKIIKGIKPKDATEST